MESKSATSATVLIDVNKYLEWSRQVKTNLTAQGLWDVVEAANEPPKAKTDEAANEPPKAKNDEAASKAWIKKNAKALKMIQNSCGPHLCSAIRMITSAKVAWDTLAEICVLPKDDYIVNELETFEAWSNRMKNYLQSLDVWDIVEAATEPSTADEIAFKAWSKKNALALYLIWESSEAYSLIGNCRTAKTAWDSLVELTKPERGADYVVQYVSLQKNIRVGNWKDARQFISSHPEAVKEKVSFKGWTALHIAIQAKNLDIVKELVNIMEEDDFKIKDADDLTVLGCCALSGNIEMAECIIKKCPILLSIENGEEKLIPVVLALNNPDIIEMARYLYSETLLEDLMPGKGVNGATFITRCIYAKAFDMALDLLECYPTLAMALDFKGESPMLALASVSLAHPGGHGLMFWKKWIYNSLYIPPAEAINQSFIAIQKPYKEKGGQVRNSVSGQGLVWNLRWLFVIKPMYELMLLRKNHIQYQELLRHVCKELPGLSPEQLEEGPVPRAIIKAAEKGMIEVVNMILSACPELVGSKENPKQRNLFMCAVLHRQIDVFRLVYDFPAKNAILSEEDSDGNNILHMAAMLEASTGLRYIPGAALQMQRELQWYKEIEGVVPPNLLNARNNKGQTPEELFAESHKGLIKEGEKWIKDTATCCVVLGALVVTIMFAAVITVPGGNDQTTGLPMFLNRKVFMVYIISDAMSLISSSISLMTFLEIFTSRYAAEDFLAILPRKLIRGIITLMFSIATMLIAFCSALSIILHGKPWMVILVILLASFPATQYINNQLPIVLDMIVATFGTRIFSKKVKPWS